MTAMIMDHFNATIFEGNLVATRRGFRVTKQKHNGMAFVNSSAQDVAPKKSAANQGVSLPIVGELKFINHGDDEKKHQPAKKRAKKARDHGRICAPKPVSRRTWSRAPGHRDSISTISSESTDDYHQPKEPRDHLTPGEDDPQSLGSLPIWASYKLHKHLPDYSMRLLFMCLAFDPSRTYHSEKDKNSTHNDGKTPERHLRVVQDPTTLHVALTLGALFDAVKSGKQESTHLTSLTSQLCSIINRRLNQNEGDGLVNGVTIHAVSALAIIAGYLGQYDHWHLHMQGLLHLIAVAGGQEKLQATTLGAVRKADFVGAVSSATKPCVPFTKGEPDIRHVLSQKRLEEDVITIERHLNACHIDQNVASTIANVAGFNDSLDQDWNDEGTERDPDAIMELYYYLNCQLLTHPEPLRDIQEVISGEYRSQKIETDSLKSFDSTMTYSNIKAIESAMRILALLYIRDPTIDLPCGETLLLDLLNQHMQTILDGRRAKHPEDSLIDPLLLEESYIAQRPTLIWMCIAGDCFTTLKMKATGEDGASKIWRSTIYKELLSDVLGLEASENPELVSEDDMELARCLDLKYLRGAHWNSRTAMRQILGVIKTE